MYIHHVGLKVQSLSSPNYSAITRHEKLNFGETKNAMLQKKVFAYICYKMGFFSFSLKEIASTFVLSPFKCLFLVFFRDDFIDQNQAFH